MLVPLRVGPGAHEVLDLHLLELARPKGEVARRNLVAKGLPDLRDAEGQFLAHRVEDILEVQEDTLGGFGPQVGDARLVLDGADERLEHQVELPRLG